jgi:hypothetical protein
MICVLIAAAASPLSSARADDPPPLEAAEAAFLAGRFDEAAAAFAPLTAADVEPLTRARAALGLSVIARQRLDWLTARAQLEAAEAALSSAKGVDDWLAIIRYELAVALLAVTPSDDDQTRAASLLTSASQGFSAAAKGARRDDPALSLWQAAVEMKLGEQSRDLAQLDAAATHFSQAAAHAASAGAPARQADALYERAQTLWISGDLDAARAQLEAAKTLFRDADDKASIARCQVALGQLLLTQGLSTEAAAAFQLALDELSSLSRARPQEATEREAEARRYELIIYQGLAEAALRSASPAEAKPHLSRARALSDALGANPLWLPQITLTQAELDLATGDRDAASLLSDLTPLCETFSADAKSALSRCQLLRARLLLDQGQTDAALTLLDTLRQSSTPQLQPQISALLSRAVLSSAEPPAALLQEVLDGLAADDPARAPLLRSLARAAAGRGDLRAAHDLFDQAQSLLMAPARTTERSQILIEDTDLWVSERNWSRAKRQGELALSLLQSVSATDADLAPARLSLARMLIARGKPSDALDLARPAADAFLAASRTDLAADALLLVAAAYDADKKPADALTALEEALSLLDKAPLTSEAARDAFLSAARFQRLADRPADAQASLEKALSFSRAQKHAPSTALALASLADLLISSGKPADALPMLSEALPLLSSPADIAAAQMSLGFASQASGDTPSAIAAFTEAARLYKDLRNRPERKRAETELKALGASP